MPPTNKSIEPKYSIDGVLIDVKEGILSVDEGCDEIMKYLSLAESKRAEEVVRKILLLPNYPGGEESGNRVNIKDVLELLRNITLK